MTADHTIEAIRARLEAATPGPWSIYGRKTDRGRLNIGQKALGGDHVAAVHSEYVEADAALIAATPTDLSLLLAVAEAAMEVRRAIMEMVNGGTYEAVKDGGIDASERLFAALSALEDPTQTPEGVMGEPGTSPELHTDCVQCFLEAAQTENGERLVLSLHGYRPPSTCSETEMAIARRWGWDNR